MCDPRCIKAFLVLNGDGHRILAKYYTDDFGSVSGQKEFETTLFENISRSGAGASVDVVLLNGYTIVFRTNIDVTFVVIGSGDENELVLGEVLDTIYHCAEQMPAAMGQIEEKTIMDGLWTLFLIVDEVIDNGMILESIQNTSEIMTRVTTAGREADLDLQKFQAEKEVKQLVSTGEKFVRYLMSG